MPYNFRIKIYAFYDRRGKGEGGKGEEGVKEQGGEEDYDDVLSCWT